MTDETWKRFIDREMDDKWHQTNHLPGTKHIVIAPDIIKEVLKTYKTGKACGYHNVYYEHLIHGGDTLL